MPTLLIDNVRAIDIEEFALRQPAPTYTRYEFSGMAPGYEHSGYTDGGVSVKGSILEPDLFSDSLFNRRHEISILDDTYLYALHNAFFTRYSYDYTNIDGELRICKIDCEIIYGDSSLISQPKLKVDHLEFKLGVEKSKKKKKVKPKLVSRGIVIFRK